MRGSILGTEVRRVEDLELLLGQGTFVDNQVEDGLAHAVFVRSPFAHATITAVDATEAKAADGVLGVYVGDELGDDRLPAFAEVHPDVGRTALAIGRVRFVGDPVALVVATTKAAALDAAELVDVDYEPLPVLTDVEDAVADGAAPQFEAVGSNVATKRIDQDRTDPWNEGDTVVRVRMVNQRIATAPIEGNALVVQPGEGRVTAYVANQAPHLVRDMLTKITGLDADQVRVVTPHVGGAFGGKIGATTDHAAVVRAAIRLGVAVKWTETRSEAMLSMQGRGRCSTSSSASTRMAGSPGCGCACWASRAPTPGSAAPWAWDRRT